ncbi:MAG: hypothetical protein KF902_12915 [Phycisphaeraceae bacterium]|nr:hypothetical protein [Phycisphaeraceae bacterium]
MHISTPQRPLQACAHLALLALLFSLLGCGSSVPTRRASLAPTGSGDSWHAVLPSPEAYPEDEITPGDPLYARRDSALAIRPEPVADALRDSWPTSERPSLANTRRIHVGRQPETVIYFRRDADRRTYRTYAR